MSVKYTVYFNEKITVWQECIAEVELENGEEVTKENILNAMNKDGIDYIDNTILWDTQESVDMDTEDISIKDTINNFTKRL